MRKISKFGLAIVTGGSSGIGNSIIERLEKLEPDARLFNLSRTKPASFTIGPKRVHLECDLADATARQRSFDQLERELRQAPDDGPILLVNNAGFGLYGSADRDSPDAHLAVIAVNVSALVELTTRLLPHLKQRGGSIMNIASTAAFQPTPFMATYGASKSFVLHWTLALQQELRGTPAHALAVCPGPTRTSFFHRAGVSGDGETPGGFSHSSDFVAAQALTALYRGRSLVTPGWPNKLLTAASSLFPLRLTAWAAARILGRLRPTANSD